MAAYIVVCEKHGFEVKFGWKLCLNRSDKIVYAGKCKPCLKG